MKDPVLPRIAAGDAAAVQECVSRYGGLLWSLACRFLGNRTDAEDAVQDVMVELWRTADRYNPALASEPTYVTMIARRRLIDRRRRAGQRPPAQPLVEGVAAAPGNGTDRADAADEAARAMEVLDSLRDEERSVLRMSIYDGRTHEEIAAATGLPLGTVKTHIRRGLIKIRERLAADPRRADGGRP